MSDYTCFVKPKSWFASIESVQPIPEFHFMYGNLKSFDISFLPNTIQEGDELILALDDNYRFFDADPHNITHAASVMGLCKHEVSASEAAAQHVELTVETRSQAFLDAVNGQARPVPCKLGLYLLSSNNYTLLAIGKALAHAILADYNSSISPVTDTDYYTKDELDDKIDDKLDKPATAGAQGQVLSLDQNGNTVWKDEESFEQEQADWTEDDSSKASYIQNKPDLSVYAEKSELATVATSGDYDDLLNKPTIPTKVSDLTNDSNFQTAQDVATALQPYSLTTETGAKLSLSMDSDYKLTIGLLNSSDTALDSKTVDLPIESMIINASYANGVLTLTLQNGQTISVDISDIVSGLVPDSRKVNGHALSADVTVTASDLGLATVATTGSYADLSDKPVIPAAQVQADWDQSDSSEADYIKNKPVIPAAQVQADWDESDSSEVSFIQNKPTLPTADQLLPASTSSDEGKVLTVDSNGDAEWAEAQGGGGGLPDYLNFRAGNAFTVKLAKVGSPNPVSLEYSLDRQTWTAFAPDETLSFSQTWTPVYFRGDNAIFSKDTSNYYKFVFSGSAPYIYGNVMSLIDKSCASRTVPNYCFPYLFSVSGNDAKIQSFNAILPATVLGQYCYSHMFDGQTGSYTFSNKVVLPATQLVDNCYSYMFNGCYSLNSVVLHYSSNPPVRFAVDGMFSGCSKLHTLICPNLNGSYLGSYYTGNWMNNAGSSADSTRCFYCLQAETIATRNGNTVPSNWTIYSLSASPAALVPSSTSTDEGKVLTVNASGTPEWAAAQGGGAAPDGDDPVWVETENTSGGFVVRYSSGWTGTIGYSYDKATWTSIVLDGTQTTLYTAVPFNGHHRVYLRKDAPNSQSAYVRIVPEQITRIGGNLASMHTAYNGTAPDYEFYNLFALGSGSTTLLRDISELRVPQRTLGANAMTQLFLYCTQLTETMPIPVQFSVPGSDTTTYLTGSWTDAFEGCSSLVRINLTLVDAAANIDKTLGLYRITDSTINGVINVLDGTTYIRVNCTDIAPNGKFSATAVGLPLLQNVQARTSNTLNPGSPYVPHYTVGSGESRTLSLNSIVMSAISGGSNMVYGEVIIDCDANGTVAYNSTYFTADSDPVVPGKRNWCVYRVLGDKGKMFVVDTQDLPSA